MELFLEGLSIDLIVLLKGVIGDGFVGLKLRLTILSESCLW